MKHVHKETAATATSLTGKEQTKIRLLFFWPTSSLSSPVAFVPFPHEMEMLEQEQFCPLDFDPERHRRFVPHQSITQVRELFK